MIRFDRRGSGLSDRVRDVPTLETRMDDLRAVMDAAGSRRGVLVATFEAASMAMLFAATYPERVAGLVLFHPLAKGVWSAEAAFVAERIPGARRFEHGGADRVFWLTPGLPEAIVEFARTAWGEPEPDMLLATVLFTDVVESTAKAVELGDRSWAEVVARHHALVRSQLERFRGREIDTAADGFFAAFDGPIRAIRCAVAARDVVRDLGLEIRAGLHTGECELIGDKPVASR